MKVVYLEERGLRKEGNLEELLMNTRQTHKKPWPSLSLKPGLSRTFSTALDYYRGFSHTQKAGKWCFSYMDTNFLCVKPTQVIGWILNGCPLGILWLNSDKSFTWWELKSHQVKYFDELFPKHTLWGGSLSLLRKLPLLPFFLSFYVH